MSGRPFIAVSKGVSSPTIRKYKPANGGTWDVWRWDRGWWYHDNVGDKTALQAIDEADEVFFESQHDWVGLQNKVQHQSARIAELERENAELKAKYARVFDLESLWHKAFDAADDRELEAVLQKARDTLEAWRFGDK